jgi:hypothetical protein
MRVEDPALSDLFQIWNKTRRFIVPEVKCAATAEQAHRDLASGSSSENRGILIPSLVVMRHSLSLAPGCWNGSE